MRFSENSLNFSQYRHNWKKISSAILTAIQWIFTESHLTDSNLECFVASITRWAPCFECKRLLRVFSTECCFIEQKLRELSRVHTDLWNGITFLNDYFSITFLVTVIRVRVILMVDMYRALTARTLGIQVSVWKKELHVRRSWLIFPFFVGFSGVVLLAILFYLLPRTAAF